MEHAVLQFSETQFLWGNTMRNWFWHLPMSGAISCLLNIRPSPPSALVGLRFRAPPPVRTFPNLLKRLFEMHTRRLVLVTAAFLYLAGLVHGSPILCPDVGPPTAKTMMPLSNLLTSFSLNEMPFSKGI